MCECNICIILENVSLKTTTTTTLKETANKMTNIIFLIASSSFCFVLFC